MHELRPAPSDASLYVGRRGIKRGAEKLHERKERSRYVLFEATANECQGARLFSACKYFARKPSLADTGSPSSKTTRPRPVATDMKMDITRPNSASLAISRSSEPRIAFMLRPRIVLARDATFVSWPASTWRV